MTTLNTNPMLATLKAEPHHAEVAVNAAQHDYNMCLAVAKYAPARWMGATVHTGRVASAKTRLDAAKAAYVAVLDDMDSFAAIMAEGVVA
jgi:hypothetical protein